MQKYIPFLITAAAPLCWAGDIVLVSGLAGKVPPFGLVFWRWFLAFLIMLPFSYKEIKNDWPVVKESWGMLSILSLLGASGFITLLYIGMQQTTVFNSSLIQSMMPFMIVIAVSLMAGKRMTLNQYLGMALSYSGIAYVLFKGDWHAVKTVELCRGDLLILLATVMYGLYSALLPKSSKLHPFTFLSCISALGAVTVLPFYCWELLTVGAMSFNLQNFLSLLYVAICPTIIAYLCWNKGISLIGPSTAGLFMFLIPVFTAIAAIPFLNQPFKFYHIIGMVCLFAGMILFNKNELFVANQE